MPDRQQTLELEALRRRIETLESRNAELESAHDDSRVTIRRLETMEKINRILHRAVDLDRMLKDVLETVLEIFQSDRAWLLYPCDPDAPSWQVPMECTRPRFPGAYALGEQIPMTPDVQGSFRDLLSTDGPVTYQLEAGEPDWDPADTFSVRSTLSMAVYPKTGSPWDFGLHQCSHRRIWTEKEKILFKDIGERIADALSIMLIYRDLEESEAHYRNFFETALVGLWRTRISDGKFLQANRTTAEILGYDTVEELLEKCKSRDLYPAEQRQQNIERLKKDGHASGLETRYRLRDGTEKDISVSARFLPEKGYIEGVAIDITERKAMEEALRAEKEFTEFALNVQNDTFFVFDPSSGKAIRWNRSFNEVSGYSDEEIREMKAPDAYYDTSDLEKAADATEKLKSQGAATFEMALRTKDGRYIPTEYSASLLRDRTGAPKYIVASGRDISRRKVAEEEKQKLRIQFHQAQKMESLGTLAGGIAHDFNNLLMGIQGNASLVLLDVEKGSGHREMLNNIEKYVQRGVDLTRQLLGLARGGKYEVRPTDMNKLIQSSAAMFGRTKKEIRIHGTYKEKLWTVDVDQGQMDQVLLNIFVNAWHAMPAGGDLRIETGNITLGEDDARTHGLDPGKYVRISIADTGTGMVPSVRQRAFDPFFTTKGMGHGTGLGLAASYGIIKNHDGTIEVESEIGKGSTFQIYLPASAKASDPDKSTESKPVRGNDTILIVDDEEMVLDVATQMLTALGYRPLTAMSGREAVDVFFRNRENIHMVILDMIMPDMSGGDVFDRLKSIAPDIKVLLSSGYSIDGQASEIIARGCSGFIQKPFKLNLLSAKIREILDGTHDSSAAKTPGSLSNQ